MKANPSGRLSGLRVGITAGPTRAWIDPVRYIANASTGALGIRIAEEIVQRGAEVDLLLGPGVASPTAAGIHIHPVESVEDLENCLESLSGETEKNFWGWVHAMAVLDFVPESYSPSKFSSAEANLTIQLKPTPKIIARFKEWFPKSLLVGFKLETTESIAELRESAVRLKQRFGCNLVVANQAPFKNPDHHSAFFLEGREETWRGPFQGKEGIARELVDWVESQTIQDVSS